MPLLSRVPRPRPHPFPPWTRPGPADLYKFLVSEVSKFGPDIEVSAQTDALISRSGRHFLTLRIAKTRVEIGLVLPHLREGGLLKLATRSEAPITHEILLSKKKDLSATLRRWLRRAYENAVPPMDAIEGRTGRTVSSWIRKIRSRGLSDRLAVVTWLRAAQGLSRVDAAFVAREYRLSLEYKDYDLLQAHFVGLKEPLRPLFERVAALFKRFGPDVSIVPTREDISVRRCAIIATIRARPKYLEIDVMIPKKVGGVDGEERQQEPRMSPRRLRIASPRQVDSRLRPLARVAYNAARTTLYLDAGAHQTPEM